METASKRRNGVSEAKKGIAELWYERYETDLVKKFWSEAKVIDALGVLMSEMGQDGSWDDSELVV